MKKILAVLLAAMMTATAFAGCGGGSDQSSNKDNSSSGSSQSSDSGEVNGVLDESMLGDEDNVTLTVWAPDAAVDITKSQTEAFTKLYPNKNITIKVDPQAESNASTLVMTDASVAADVFGMASDQLDALTDSKVILPVATAIAEKITAANTPESVNAGTVDGNLYYFPETTNGYFLSYDNTVLTAEDVQKFETILEKCKAADKKFIMDAGNGFYSCVFIFTGGCKIDGFEEGKNKVQKFTEYDADKVAATLSAFAKLFKEYKGTFQSLATEKIPSGFSNGSLGAGIDGSWDTANIVKALGDKAGFAKLPTINVNGEDLQMVSLYGYKALAVNASTKFPRTAQALAYYLTGEQCQKERAEKLSWGPTNTALADTDVVKNSPDLAASVEQAKYAVPQVHIGNFWDPLGALGAELTKDDCKVDDLAGMKTLLEKTVIQVKDE